MSRTAPPRRTKSKGRAWPSPIGRQDKEFYERQLVQAQQLAAGMWGEFVKLQEAIKGGRKPEYDYAKALDISRQLGLSAAGGIEAPVTADADAKPVPHLRFGGAKATFTSDPQRSVASSKAVVPHKPRLKVFIACMTSQHESSSVQRDLIRNTWMKDLHPVSTGSSWAVATQPLKIGMRFFLGGQQKKLSANLTNEIAKYGDVVVLDAPDHYEGLRTKVLVTMQWVHKHVNTSFLLKVDDDCYVNVNVLVKEAAKLPRRRAYYGFMHSDQEVVQNNPEHKNSENHLPKGMPATFPPYASGAAYMLTQDLVEYLAFPRVQPLRMLNEDAYVGVALLPLDITRHDGYKLIYPLGIRRREGKNRCIDPRTTDFLAIHYVKAVKYECMSIIHDAVKSGKPICASKYCPPGA